MLSRIKALVAPFLMVLVSLSYPVSTFAVDFSNPKSYPVGTRPSDVVVGDFNGDGKPDIAVANRGSGNVSILLNNGDGTFAPAMNFEAGDSPSVLASGDFNADGKLDLAVFQPGNPDLSVAGSVNVLLGNGDGSFRAPQTMTLTPFAYQMAVADFNLDKKSDLAVSSVNFSTGTPVVTLSIFLGKGDGTFQPETQISAPAPGIGRDAGVLTTGEFNGDGKPDLALANRGDGSISILLGKGDGTFQQTSTVGVAVGFSWVGVQVADVNHDGKQDLVVNSMHFQDPPPGNNEGPTSRADHTSVFLGNGNGTFQGEQIVAISSWRKANVFAPAVGDSISPAVIGDYNGDGELDLAFLRTTLLASRLNHASLDVTLGRGDGTFSSALSFSPANSIGIGASGDLNGDKLSDLVFLDVASSAAVVELNTSPTSGADLGITAAGADKNPVGVGTNLTYFADVLNEGPQDATGVTFTDTLPNGVNFVSATTTRGTCTQTRGVVTCNLGSVPDAEFAEVKIIVTPNSAGTITNSMNVTANESDLALANNSATQTTAVDPVFTLTVAKAGNGSGTIQSGSSIDCGTTCSATFLSGNTVALVALPSSKSVFAGWSGGCTGTDPNVCSVTMNSNQSVTAQFAPAPDFTLNPASSSLTMKRGGQVSDVLTFPTQGGFSGAIALVCSVSGPVPMPTCGLSPASVTPGTNATLTVNAAALSASLTAPWFEQGARLSATWLPLGLLGCVLASGFDKKRRRMWGLCLLLLVATILPAACGGGNSVPPPPVAQSYTVTVTATSGAIQHSAVVTVTVN
jgi:uncharacterized repeat protein (TIGR01451 family)